jgi:hypothetical protein
MLSDILGYSWHTEFDCGFFLLDREGGVAGQQILLTPRNTRVNVNLDLSHIFLDINVIKLM